MVRPKTQHGLCYAKNRVLHQHMFRQSDLLTQINSYKNMYKDMLSEACSVKGYAHAAERRSGKTGVVTE
jgi:hypothetical protein